MIQQGGRMGESNTDSKDGKASPSEAPDPATLNEVLYAEISRLRPALFQKLQPSKFSDDLSDRAENLKSIYCHIASLSTQPSTAQNPGSPLAALCLSGGGIRSATFNLGVLQSLARLGMLSQFDYLSSVSGGGYIASWLRTWIHRESHVDPAGIAHRDGLSEVENQLGYRLPNVSSLSPEPIPVSNLRDFSNYLTPQVGLFSGDTWAAAAIIARNLLLNWLVLVPLLSAAIGIPLLFLLLVRLSPTSEGWCAWSLAAAIAIELIASVLVYCFRRFAKDMAMKQWIFIACCVLPICLAAGVLSAAALWLDLPWRNAAQPSANAIKCLRAFAMAWCIGVPLLGWLVAEALAYLFPEWTRPSTDEGPDDPASESQRDGQRGAVKAPKASEPRTKAYLPRDVPFAWEFVALILSGAAGMIMLLSAISAWYSYFYARPALYVILAPTILLAIYLISRALFVGFASLRETFQHAGKKNVSGLVSSDDSDREWWARLSGWVLLVMVVWMGVTAVCLLGSYIPESLENAFNLSGNKWGPALVAAGKWIVGAVAAISGLIAALTGHSAKTPGACDAKPTSITNRTVAIAGPLFVVCLIILLSWEVKELGSWVTQNNTLFDYDADQNRDASALHWNSFFEFAKLIVALVAVGLVAGCIVNVNRFSMHGMYRNRLVRAYLGASNGIDARHPRIPDPFTGFALSDNLGLHELGACYPNAQPLRVVRPFPIINTTLNLVHGDDLAWQQRKAESFSMTPLHCGNWSEGYRPSQLYGGSGGITVGTAVTISGAAANPNMGYSSSPVLSFLMAIFNVRLGAWLGNTNPAGKNSYTQPGPRQAIMPLFAEMFGLTNSDRRYINLSDGGHFDNLGLYEIVLRRCRYVLVSDAGQDGSFSFEDLGNAIRKIRIDFGIDIVFEKKIKILPNASDKKGLYCAIARIRYSQIDKEDAEDGHLIYIKPSLKGDSGKDRVLPYDIYSYSRSSAEFPHESTADQWFTESQFESYRALGSHIIDQISEQDGKLPLQNARFNKLLTVVSAYIDRSQDGAFEDAAAADSG
jgi:hypothetical protein